jgi:cytochrome P450
MSESSASIVLALLVILAAILFYLIHKRITFLRKLPPGPWGIPILGSMPILFGKNVFAEFEKYRQQYGDIFSVGLGDFNCIVLNGHKLIQEAFRRDEFQGRPELEIWKIRNAGFKNRGILFCDGNHTWNEQRRFALRNLRDFGFGKESMEGLLLHELQEFLNHLDKEVGKPVDLKNIFNASVLNSLWFLITSHRFDLQDPDFKKVIALLTTNVKESDLVGPALWFPSPAKWNIVARGKWNHFLETLREILGIMQTEVDKHVNNYVEGNSNDFIDVYLQHRNQSDPSSSFYGKEGMENLIYTIFDLFVAGAETTSTTLLWCMLHLSKNKKIQEKLFAEINSVVGKNPPSRDDKARMPYTEAVLNEVHRHCSLVPFSVFHSMMEDTKFEGHFFPKGTVILANMYAAHHDKDFWKDPENFCPERFLDSTGTKVIKQEALMPFSTGKRACLGEALARDTLFLFLTGIVQHYSFELVPGSTTFDPKDLPTNCSFVLQPEPFQIILKKRN